MKTKNKQNKADADGSEEPAQTEKIEMEAEIDAAEKSRHICDGDSSLDESVKKPPKRKLKMKMRNSVLV